VTLDDEAVTEGFFEGKMALSKTSV
jgi:hypothetical protein